MKRKAKPDRKAPTPDELREPVAGIGATSVDELDSRDPLPVGQPAIGRSTHGTGATGGSSSGAGARASRRPGGY